MLARFALIALTLTVICSAFPGRALAHSSVAATQQDPWDPQPYPAAWAGIWDVYWETHDCTSGALIRSGTYRDTVCAGDLYYLLTGYGLGFSCTGPGFTDTTLNLQCSGGSTQGCVGNEHIVVTRTVSWTLSGDVATTDLVETDVFSGPQGCQPPNECFHTTGTMTRLVRNPATCAPTPTLRRSWGTLKIIYR